MENIDARHPHLVQNLHFALCVLSAHGQAANTGAIAGTISDPSGALVAGAAVVVNNQRRAR